MQNMVRFENTYIIFVSKILFGFLLEKLKIIFWKSLLILVLKISEFLNQLIILCTCLLTFQKLSEFQDPWQGDWKRAQSGLGVSEKNKMAPMATGALSFFLPFRCWWESVLEGKHLHVQNTPLEIYMAT